MHNLSQYNKKNFSIMRIVYVLVLTWTFIIVMSAAWNIYRPAKRSYEMALIEAKNSLKKDVAYRRWNAMHGSVYVPLTKNNLPNPYLSAPERDITTQDGKHLTLINPAYMTRQVYELMQAESGVKGHITSLNPIRPENKPDDWETKALHLFERGTKELSSAVKINGREYMRYMAPLITEKPCLNCHAFQGYREGDIRGGISVSVPLDAYKSIIQKDILWRALAHGLVWLLGLGILAVGSSRVIKIENEQKMISQRLEESEKRYRSIFDNAIEGIFQSSPQGYFISVNKAMARIHGYDSPEDMIEAITDISSQLYVIPEDRIRFKKMLEEHGKVENFEVKVFKKDGKTIWTSISSRAIRDDAGNIISFEGIVQDITEQKEAEEKLRKYTEEISDLYNNAPCGYHSLGPDGIFLSINNTELSWLGHDRDEIVGKMKFTDLLNAEDFSAFQTNFNILKEQGWAKDVEYVIARKDGTTFPVLLNSTVLKDNDGNTILIRSTIFDITELKRAERELHLLNETLEQRVQLRTEDMKKARRVALSMMQDAELERKRVKEAMEKLRESSEKLQILSNAVQQSPSSIVITNREGSIQYVNPKFAELTGYETDEVIGMNPRILKSGMHDEQFYRELWETILSGKEWHGEFCNRKKNGQLIWERVSISSVQNDSGEISYFISVREDITERKHLDDELKERMEELERFSRLTVDREGRMIQLKEEINALLEQMGKEKKYKIVE